MNFQTIKKILVNLSLFLAATLFFLVLTEIACRLFFIYPHKIKSAKTDILKENYINKTDGLRYRLNNGLINAESYSRFDFVPGENKITKEKKPKIFRIALLGDSFTMGGGVKFKQDSYGARLFQLLNENKEKIGEVEGFEILIFGDGGLNTLQESVLLPAVALKYNPDLVILQSTDNDLNPIRSEYFTSTDGQIYTYTKTDSLMIGDKIIPQLPFLSRKTNRFILKHSALSQFISYKLNIVVTNLGAFQSEEVCFDSIKKMADILSARQTPFIVINLAPASTNTNFCGEVPYHLEGLNLHRKLKKLAQDLNIYFYDICDYVADINSIKSELEDNCTQCHYNKEGYQIVAEILKEAVFKIISKN